MGSDSSSVTCLGCHRDPPKELPILPTMAPTGHGSLCLSSLEGWMVVPFSPLLHPMVGGWGNIFNLLARSKSDLCNLNLKTRESGLFFLCVFSCLSLS